MSWSRMVRDGELIAALPGVVIDARLRDDPLAWIRAVQAWNPNAVIAGAAAAKLTFAPELKLTTVRVYTSSKVRDNGPLEFRRRTIEPELLSWSGALRLTTPEITALTAGLDGDFEPGTEALRRGLVTPSSLAHAAVRWNGRPETTLNAVVKAFRDNPWSVAEVDVHRLFRESGLIGWEGNPRVCIDGRNVFPDIALVRSKIAFEVDSFAYHSAKEQMERDAGRTNLLLSAGWRRYTLLPTQIRNHPEETVEFLKGVVPSRYQRGVGGPGR